MNIIRVRNVNEALYRGVQLLDSGEARIISPRGAKTLEWPEPVATVYEHPKERVIFSPTRDANPFFHFFESLWMLAGRNDVEFVKFFNKRMQEFSDDAKIFHAAYGFRWREHFGMGDQLSIIISILRQDPASRRAVLAMWDADADLGGSGKDLPCNTHVYFKVREGSLHMTVCNRSNDMIWGAYGANAVHLSFLHEYIAGNLGVDVGVYTQISDSFHVYVDGPGGELWESLKKAGDLHMYDFYNQGEHVGEEIRPYPMFQSASDVENFEQDLLDFFEGWTQRNGDDQQPDLVEYQTPFFVNVVAPMYRLWRTRNPIHLEYLLATDWNKACSEWLARRVKK